MKNDKLDQLFNLQENFQKKCGLNPFEFTMANYKDQTLALIAEIFEALNETAWKPWKRNQEYNIEKLKEELIDAWHFLINLTLLSGMDSNEFFYRFLKKNIENHKRQDEGY